MSALSQNPHRNFATLLCSRSSYEPADDVGALRSGYKAKASACLGRMVVRDRRVVPDADHLATWFVGQCVARLACRLNAVPMVKRDCRGVFMQIMSSSWLSDPGRTIA